MSQFLNDPNATNIPSGTSTWASQPGGPQAQAQVAPTWVAQSNARASAIERDQWTGLRLIARMLKIVAWIELAVGILSSINLGVFIGGGWFADLALTLTFYSLVITVLGFAFIYATAELIQVFLAIEKNTRKTE